MVEVRPSSLCSVLLVEPDHVDRVLIHSTLASVGFTVTVTNSYDEACDELTSRPPLILMSAVRLGTRNGLELAHRAFAGRPRMAVVLTSSTPDPDQQARADRIGATFVLKPVTAEDLLAAVYRTALRPCGAGAGAASIRPPFERRRGERRASQGRATSADRRRTTRRRDVHSLLLGLPATR